MRRELLELWRLSLWPYHALVRYWVSLRRLQVGLWRLQEDEHEAKVGLQNVVFDSRGAGSTVDLGLPKRTS